MVVQAVTLDVEDLEADATPEDLMLSYVSGEKGKVCAVSCQHCKQRTALHELVYKCPMLILRCFVGPGGS